MKKLRDYQINNSEKAIPILKKYGIVYFACEVRFLNNFLYLCVCRVAATNKNFK